MLPEVRGHPTSMTNLKINQRLKAFCHQHTGIRLALIPCEEPRSALLLLIVMDDVSNGEFTYIHTHCISGERWNITLAPSYTTYFTTAWTLGIQFISIFLSCTISKKAIVFNHIHYKNLPQFVSLPSQFFSQAKTVGLWAAWSSRW